MRRVAVVGSSGAGKTTFARTLGHRQGIPVLSLDEHYWQPGWQRPDRQRWREHQTALLDGHASWIADGNYWSSLDIRLARADTVIVLDMPRWRCLAQALWRNVRHRGQPLQARGCPERISAGFLGYIWSFPTQHRPRLHACLNDAAHLRVIQLRNRRHLRTFLTDQR